MPAGIYLLNALKRLHQLLQTCPGKRNGKFTRIVTILEVLHQMKFILLGDSPQREPYIYAADAEHLPNQAYAVYIRDIKKKNRTEAAKILHGLEAAGIPFFFSSRRRHTRLTCDWSSDVCSSD